MSLLWTPVVVGLVIAFVSAQQILHESGEVDYNGDSGSRKARESGHSNDVIPPAKGQDLNQPFCHAKAEDKECIQRNDEKLEQEGILDEEDKYSLPSKLYHRSMEGLGEMLGQVEKSRANVIKKLEGVMDQVAHSEDQMMKGFDDVMDKVSESMSESKVRVIKSFDRVMDKMIASKLLVMEEIDHVIEEIKALPGELRESFVLSVRNRSYIAAGVMVAVTAAILIGGAVYFAWCHHDAWSYQRVPLDEHHFDSGDGVPAASSEATNEAVSENGKNAKPATNGSSVHHRKPNIADIGSYTRQTNGSVGDDHNTEPLSSDINACVGKENKPIAELTQSQSAKESEQSKSECNQMEQEIACLSSTPPSQDKAVEEKAAQGSHASPAHQRISPQSENNATGDGTVQVSPVTVNSQEPAQQVEKAGPKSIAKEADSDDNFKESGAGDEGRGNATLKPRSSKGEGDFQREISTSGEKHNFGLSSGKMPNISDKLTPTGSNRVTVQDVGAEHATNARR